MKRKWAADLSWQTKQFTQLGMFTDLEHLLSLSVFNNFPTAKQLTQQAHSLQESLLDYQFIAQDDNFNWQGLSYEALIYQKKTIPTRINNWHDCFNACIWTLMPNSKKVFNQLHVADIDKYGLKQRTKQRDALTLFDECGIIIAYQDEQDKLDLQQHQWLTSFWQNRDKWFKQLRPFIFGHAMYEMGLKPFIGLTAKAYFIQVKADFWLLSLTQQYQYLDQALSYQMRDWNCFADNKALSPLPLLGVPGWSQDNENKEYYANTRYFRPKRQQK